jgi:oxygen-independent coproporphyrinogen-3 oxidase
MSLNPEHVSMYALSIEPNTPFDVSLRAGQLSEPDPDLAADMYLAACEMLENAGFSHYEISNWAVQGRESAHNLAYWKNQPYLGLGPGAHSSLLGKRWAAMKSPRGYMDVMSQIPSNNAGGGESWFAFSENLGLVEGVEVVDRALEIADTMMMGLRLRGGIDRRAYEDRFGEDPIVAYKTVINELKSLDLIEVGERHLRVPHRSWLLANEAYGRFVEAAAALSEPQRIARA